MGFIIVPLILALIPYMFNWSIFDFFVLIILTFGAFQFLLMLCNTPNKVHLYMGEHVNVVSAYFSDVLENTIAYSSFNDKLIAIYIVILVVMIINSLIFGNRSYSIYDKLLFIWNNKQYCLLFIWNSKKDLLLILLTIWFLIIVINAMLFTVGLGIVVNTTSFKMFLYTFLAKVTSIRVVLTIIISSITKQLRIEHFSISISTVLFMSLLGGVNYFYLIPYINMLASPILAYLGSKYLEYCSLVDFKYSYNEDLVEGICNILNKFPIISKYLPLFTKQLYNTNTSYILSPFRLIYTKIIKVSNPFIPLTKLSKFTSITIATIIPNKADVFISYKGRIADISLLFRSFAADISKFVSNCSNLKCEINLTNTGEIVTINSVFKNLCFEEYYLEKITGNIKSNFSYEENSIYYKSNFRVKELLALTDPARIGSDLKVYMERAIQQDTDSRITDKGKRKMVEFEDYPVTDEEYDLSEYDCIRANLYFVDNRPRVLLDFDPNMLLEEDYLIDLLTKGRSVIYYHYLSRNLSEEDITNCIDEFKFEHLNMGFENSDKDYVKLHDAFLKKCKGIMTSKNIKHDNIKPFSTDYIDYLKKSRLNIADSSISDLAEGSNYASNSNLAEANISDLASFSISDVVYPPVSDLEEASSSNVADNTSLDKEHGLEPAEIRALLNELRSRQKNFYFSKEPNSLTCKLSELGIRSKNRIYKDNGEINPITRTLSKVYQVKYDDIVKYHSKSSRLTVNDICFVLNGLLEDRVMNQLTNAECGTLCKGLKIRMNKFIDNRISQGLPGEACQFNDLNFIYSGGVILELNSENIDNDFSYLLTRLVFTQQRLFENTVGKLKFSCASLNLICNSLFHQSNPEILTKREMSLVVNELETRKAAIKFDEVKFTHLKLSRKSGKILEDFKSSDFTDLLERLYYQDSNLFNERFYTTNVNTLIKNVKNIFSNE